MTVAKRQESFFEFLIGRQIFSELHLKYEYR